VANNTKKYVDSLIEGVEKFPVILKVAGKGRFDYIKADGKKSLLSLLDYFWALKRKVFIQPLIPIKRFTKILVLGDRAIGGLEVVPQEKTVYWTGKRFFVIPMAFDEAIVKEAVRAAQSLKLEFASVEILIDDKGKHYINDVYFPPNFYDFFVQNNVNVPEMIIEYLLKKNMKKGQLINEDQIERYVA
jgi:glutathione synthase/RimK-type ligase-like ATP-grasp enzyme